MCWSWISYFAGLLSLPIALLLLAGTLTTFNAGRLHKDSDAEPS